MVLEGVEPGQLQVDDLLVTAPGRLLLPFGNPRLLFFLRRFLRSGFFRLLRRLFQFLRRLFRLLYRFSGAVASGAFFSFPGVGELPASGCAGSLPGLSAPVRFFDFSSAIRNTSFLVFWHEKRA